jgi:spermidine/putrescine-binding protein
MNKKKNAGYLVFAAVFLFASLMFSLVLMDANVALAGSGDKKADEMAELAGSYEELEEEFGGELNGLFLAGYDDEQALKPFLDKYGITLKSTYFGTFDEAFNKVKTSAPGTFDIISVNNGYVPIWTDADILEPLNIKLIPNWKNMFEFFQNTNFGVEGDKNKYVVPFTWGSAVCNYNSKFMDPINSWYDLLDPKYKGKIAMVDDYQGQIIMAAKVTGYKKANHLLTKEELDRAVDFLIELKANSKTIAPTWGDLISMFLAQDVWTTNEGWEYLSVTGQEENIPIYHNIPSEGAFSWCDTIAIVKDAPNIASAYGLLNTF